jgi:hypothetical protein
VRETAVQSVIWSQHVKNAMVLTKLQCAQCTVSTNGVKVPKDQLKCANFQNKHSGNDGGCITRQNYITSRPKKEAPKRFQPRGGHSNFSQRYFTQQQQQQLPHATSLYII